MTDPERNAPSMFDRLKAEAFDEVTNRYGDGESAPSELDLPYHNLNHSVRVSNAAVKLVRHLGLDDRTKQLVGLIGAAHDVIHERDGDNTPEELSVDWLCGRMARDGFDDGDIIAAELAVLGTTCTVSSDGMDIRQAALDIPFLDARSETIALCIASADMEAFVAPHGPRVVHDLWREYSGLTTALVPEGLDGLATFQRIQLGLLTNYRYPQIGAESIFGGLRREALCFHESLLRDIEAGDLTTWNQLVARDVDYLQTYQT